MPSTESQRDQKAASSSCNCAKYCSVLGTCYCTVISPPRAQCYTEHLESGISVVRDLKNKEKLRLVGLPVQTTITHEASQGDNQGTDQLHHHHEDVAIRVFTGRLSSVLAGVLFRRYSPVESITFSRGVGWRIVEPVVETGLEGWSRPRC